MDGRKTGPFDIGNRCEILVVAIAFCALSELSFDEGPLETAPFEWGVKYLARSVNLQPASIW
jgi:hypothetical protein